MVPSTPQMAPPAQVRDSRREILRLLQRGTRSVEDLSQALEMSPTAVRQHLAILEADGFIRKTPQRQGMGRPRIYYDITNEAEVAFPKKYGLLAELLLEGITEAGQDPLLITRGMGDRLARRYEKEAQSRNLKGRVQLFVDILIGMGVEADFDETDGEYIVREMTCPYHDVTLKYPSVCELDQNFIQKIVGKQVSLESRLLGRHNYCSYVIKK